MPTEIKVICPVCKKEIKVLLHMVDKLSAENESLKRQLQKVRNTNMKSNSTDIPDFMRDLFK
jgi:hypothetical protein